MKKGDIVYTGYEARIKENDQLFGTTDEELAKTEDIYDENTVYGPIPIVIGQQSVLKGADHSLLKATVGKEYIVEVKPPDAYGERDPHKVEIVSHREFRRQKITPEVGLDVIIKNKPARITAVTAGRVMVDFNHRLAGRTLVYKYKITKKVGAAKDKVLACIDMHYGKPEEFKVTVKSQEAVLTLPEVCKYDQKWFLSKYRVVNDLKNIVNLNKIVLVEEYLKKEKTEKAEESEKTPKKEDEKSSEKEGGGASTKEKETATGESKEKRPEKERPSDV